MEPGTKVIIRQNPHHHGAEDIVGAVVSYRSREGFGGCDMLISGTCTQRLASNTPCPFARFVWKQ